MVINKKESHILKKKTVLYSQSHYSYLHVESLQLKAIFKKKNYGTYNLCT